MNLRPHDSHLLHWSLATPFVVVLILLSNDREILEVHFLLLTGENSMDPLHWFVRTYGVRLTHTSQVMLWWCSDHHLFSFGTKKVWRFSTIFFEQVIPTTYTTRTLSLHQTHKPIKKLNYASELKNPNSYTKKFNKSINENKKGTTFTQKKQKWISFSYFLTAIVHFCIKNVRLLATREIDAT